MFPSCSVTRCLAQYASVPSSNSICTRERPKMVRERTVSTRGTPSIAFSTGIVTWRSTSSGARPG